jgi:hypothetical protein
MGPVASADNNVEVQIRDFDQTVIGNPAHDLIRLGLSPLRPLAAPICRATMRVLEQVVKGIQRYSRVKIEARLEYNRTAFDLS